MSFGVSTPAAAECGPVLEVTRRTARRVAASLPWRPFCDAAFAAVLLAFCALTVYTGAVQTHTDGHDIFFFLDGGWRALHGQRPHVDFVSPFGPVIFLLEAAGLRLAGLAPDGVGYASALFGFLAGVWAYLVARARLAPVFAWMAGASTALLCMAPFPLGVNPAWSSHAMAYNRYGFALLMIVELECLQPGPRGRYAWSGGASSGVAVAVALFLKASYFFASLPLLVMSVFYGDQRRARWRGLAAGFGIVAFLFLAYLRFDLVDILTDLGMAASSRPRAWTPYLVLDLLGRNWIYGLLYPGAAALALWMAQPAPHAAGWRGWVEELRPLLLVLLVFWLGMLLIASNSEREGLPLTALLCIIFLNRAFTLPRGGVHARGVWPVLLVTGLFGGMVWAALASADLTGLALSAGRKWRSPQPAVARFDAPRLARLFLYEPSEGELRSNGHTYVRYVNDGLRLLRQYSSPGDPVFTMDMVNPFPYALGRPPMHGGLPAMAWNYSISPRHRPPADRLFGNAAVLMIPKHPAIGQEYFDGYVPAYRAEIDRRFRLAAESDWWWLYRRVR